MSGVSSIAAGQRRTGSTGTRPNGDGQRPRFGAVKLPFKYASGQACAHTHSGCTFTCAASVSMPWMTRCAVGDKVLLRRLTTPICEYNRGRLRT
jgi:hypothetical protein